MEKIVEQAMLYDFYGELLTEHQRQIYEDVVFENLSLGEIAQEEGVSRQAVHDIVKRCDKALSEYEEKLKLVQKFIRIKEKIEEIDRLSEQYEDGTMQDRESFGAKVREISGEILEQL
jgi:uncharacterized protein